jgi:hypothetical protein
MLPTACGSPREWGGPGSCLRTHGRRPHHTDLARRRPGLGCARGRDHAVDFLDAGLPHGVRITEGIRHTDILTLHRECRDVSLVRVFQLAVVGAEAAGQCTAHRSCALQDNAEILHVDVDVGQQVKHAVTGMLVGDVHALAAGLRDRVGRLHLVVDELQQAVAFGIALALLPGAAVLTVVGQKRVPQLLAIHFLDFVVRLGAAVVPARVGGIERQGRFAAAGQCQRCAVLPLGRGDDCRYFLGGHTNSGVRGLKSERAAGGFYSSRDLMPNSEK